MEVASYEGTAFFVRDNRTAITAGHVVPRNGLDSLAMLMTLDDKFVTIPVRQAYCSRLYDVAVIPPRSPARRAHEVRVSSTLSRFLWSRRGPARRD
jgi:hypothetical protein